MSDNKTTLREFLDIEKNGRNTIREKAELDNILECVDDISGMFLATKHVKPLLESLDQTKDYVRLLNKAVANLKVYESKEINEEEMKTSSARILAYDIHKSIEESYSALISHKREFKEMDKTNISKIYSSMLFELEMLCRKYNIILENIIDSSDTVMFESVSNEMAKIISEVLWTD